MLSSRSLKLHGAEKRYCLMLSFELGLCAQQGSNGSSVLYTDHLIALLKPIQGPADLNTMTVLRQVFFSFAVSPSLLPPSRLFHPKPAVSLISKCNNRGGIYCGDFGAELNRIPALMSNRTSQMVQDTLCTVGCSAPLCVDAASIAYFTAVCIPAAWTHMQDESTQVFLLKHTMHSVVRFQ